MNIKYFANKALFGLKKASPTIAVGGGIIFGLAGTYFACKATLEVDAVLDETRHNVEIIRKTAADPEIPQYGEENKQRDLVRCYLKLFAELAKLYGPSIAAWVISILLTLYSHRAMSKRVAALGGACAAYAEALRRSKANIAEQYGEEKAEDIYYGLHNEKVEETITDENGAESKKKVVVKAVDSSKVISPYAVFFDNSNPNYIKDDPVHNSDFIADIQMTMNTLLRQRGWLFLNDVRQALGFKPIPEGQVLGWVWDDKEDCPFDADNPKIDLGISHIGRQEVRDFRNGYEKVFVIDFDVQPIIESFHLFDKSNRIA